MKYISYVLYGVDHVFCVWLYPVVSYLSVIYEVNIMFCMERSSCPFVWVRRLK